MKFQNIQAIRTTKMKISMETDAQITFSIISSIPSLRERFFIKIRRFCNFNINFPGCSFVVVMLCLMSFTIFIDYYSIRLQQKIYVLFF